MIPGKTIEKKNVLLISYHFPPCNQSASKRSGCLAKYLPDFYWQPNVITRKWTKNNCIYDESFIANLPKDVVVGEIEDSQYATLFPAVLLRKIYTFSLPHRFPFHFRNNAKKNILEIVLRKKIDIIWATSPPDAPLWLACWCSKKCNIPWIADFRDVWGSDPFISKNILAPVRIFHEKRMLKSASAIVTVSGHLADILRKRHKKEITNIPNGFDPQDIATSQIKRIDKFRLIYTGSQFVENRGDPILIASAISQLIQDKLVDGNDISLEYYSEHGDLLSKLLGKKEFSGFVKIYGRIPSKDCLEVQRNAAILIQSNYKDLKGIMSGKIFEYLAAKRPILAVPNDHDCVENVLKETGAGVSCTTLQEIMEQILGWYKEWRKTGTVEYQGCENAILKYSRKEQAGMFAELFNKAIRGYQIKNGR